MRIWNNLTPGQKLFWRTYFCISVSEIILSIYDDKKIYRIDKKRHRIDVSQEWENLSKEYYGFIGRIDTSSISEPIEELFRDQIPEEKGMLWRVKDRLLYKFWIDRHIYDPVFGPCDYRHEYYKIIHLNSLMKLKDLKRKRYMIYREIPYPY